MAGGSGSLRLPVARVEMGPGGAGVAVWGWPCGVMGLVRVLLLWALACRGGTLFVSGAGKAAGGTRAPRLLLGLSRGESRVSRLSHVCREPAPARTGRSCLGSPGLWCYACPSRGWHLAPLVPPCKKTVILEQRWRSQDAVVSSLACERKLWISLSIVWGVGASMGKMLASKSRIPGV